MADRISLEDWPRGNSAIDGDEQLKLLPTGYERNPVENQVVASANLAGAEQRDKTRCCRWLIVAALGGTFLLCAALRDSTHDPRGLISGSNAAAAVLGVDRVLVGGPSSANSQMARATSTCELINDRFQHGTRAGTSLTSAGVLTHQFDFERDDTPWLPGPGPCDSNPGGWCAEEDRVSCSLLNAAVSIQNGVINLYISPPESSTPNVQPGGVILRPMSTRVQCMFSRDGGTYNRRDRGCGCPISVALPCNSSCVAPHPPSGQCAWPAPAVSQMLQSMDRHCSTNDPSCTYNEIVLDPQQWKSDLPHTIEAFFFPSSIHCDDSCVQQARSAHARFSERYPGSAVPLLILNVNGSDRPFSVDESSIAMSAHETSTAGTDSSSEISPTRDGNLKSALMGLPGSAIFERGTEVWNTLLPQANTSFVYQCRSTADVVSVVQYARSHGMTIRVRAGGHSYTGESTCRSEKNSLGCIVADIRGINTLQVLESAHNGATTAVVGAGILTGDLLHELDLSGYYAVTGTCGSVGYAGLCLGGGIGLLSRQHGLAADQVVSMQVVTPDGQIRTVNATHFPDLFYALRGAGKGNFGIVTSFTIKIFPTNSEQFWAYRWIVCGNGCRSAAEQQIAADVLHQWSTWVATADRRVYSQAAFGGSSALSMKFSILFHTSGSEAEKDAAIPAWVPRNAMEPEVHWPDGSGTPEGMKRWTAQNPMSWSQAYRLYKDCGPRLGMAAVHSRYGFTPLSRLAARALVDAVSTFDGSRCKCNWADVLIDGLGGAINDIPTDATAFPHRSAVFQMQYNVKVTETQIGGANLQVCSDWLNRVYLACNGSISNRAYANYPDLDLSDWQHEYYGENYARLQTIKSTFDPTDTLDGSGVQGIEAVNSTESRFISMVDRQTNVENDRAVMSPDVRNRPVVDVINHRFVTGAAVDDVARAGIVIHQFDDTSDPESGQKWMPCPKICWGSPCYCAKHGDRFSASLLSSQSPPADCSVGDCVPWSSRRQFGLFKDSRGMYSGGFVLAPSRLNLLCSYPGDGGTMTRLCLDEHGNPLNPGHPCVPGCGCQDSEPTPCDNSCAAPPPPTTMHHQCAWPADELSHMLHVQQGHGEGTGTPYNELILSASTWVANLPGSIEAVFYPAGCGPECEAAARQTHAAFIARYPEAASTTPLLELDVTNWTMPFTVAAN
eukprot:SAG31_NODE_2852_length_4995_cov_42.074551_2_plen_1180_part_00